MHHERAAIGTGPRAIRDCDRTAAAVGEPVCFEDGARLADDGRARFIVGRERAIRRAGGVRRVAAGGAFLKG